MSDQELETTFEEQFQPEEVEPEVETVETPEPEAPAYEYAGQTYTREQLDPALRFAQWASQNPERWQQLQQWEAGQLQFVPPPAPELEPEPEVGVDVYSEDYLRRIGQETQELRRELERQRLTEGRAAVDAGITGFSQAHPDLNKADMDRVLQWVHDRRSLESIPPDLPYSAKLDAVKERFEEGFKVVFYERVQQEASRQTVNDLNKRRRAAASSSSGVSSPRVAPEPTTPQERRAAITDEIAQALAEGN